MEFLNRQEELRRLDHALQRRGFAVLWGRRRVGKSRLLLEWCRRCGGTYMVADRSVPAVQRRYLAIAMAERFPGFDTVEYPNWRSFFDRVGAEADRVNWHGPLVLDELPYLIAADPTLPGVLQNWIDAMTGRLCVVVSGSSVRMMHGAVLDAGAPLYGRAVEAFAVRPLRPGWLAAVFGAGAPRELVSLYALLGGLPRYWELAEGLGAAANRPAIRNGLLADALVLDPRSPLHNEPERLLLEETPPAAALRPLLDAVGSGTHRVSEIAGRLGRPASSLSRPLAALVEMSLLRRETPFGSPPGSGKRVLYRIDDAFLHLWFRVVAPRRAMFAEAPRETRIGLWHRQRAHLEAAAWEELCRLAIPTLHRHDTPLGRLGPWEPAQRHWSGRGPEIDVVARSADGRRLLLGEAKWSVAGRIAAAPGPRPDASALPGAQGCEVVLARFVPAASTGFDERTGTHLVDAGGVLRALR